ncbi:MAG: hypothetical protein IJ041_03520, partial [Clostridia bacterium]|nr:hypothetical protein [Clostridia bacterium]
FLSRKFKFTISILSQQHKKTQARQGLRFRCLHNGWRRITPSFPSPSLAAAFFALRGNAAPVFHGKHWKKPAAKTGIHLPGLSCFPQ